ncbi:MAG: hypothetical protein BRD49_02805 [Bacteroidetes bacterium SW_10_40_5]|nr:MAG: hypothetical protein BRD49_02805 [Bacteroidetes bacterium SW_10_40_5]
MKHVLFMVGVAGMFLIACVPQRKVEDLRKDKAALQKELDTCNMELKTLKSDYKELNQSYKEKISELQDVQKQAEKLAKDTSLMGNSIRKLKNLNDQLNRTYEKLIKNNKELLSDKAEKTQNLIKDLNNLRAELKEKEQKLLDREAELQNRNNELDTLRDDLMKREKRVKELESVLTRKDSIVKSLKKTISDALYGFRDSGLSVEMKNSKVYVSLQERLLFESGQYNIDKEGEEALMEIANVLKNKPSINIMVEGHTDDQKLIGGSDIKDNWELSVLRATEVVRILENKGGVAPDRLIAAGRGPYAAVAEGDTPEARRKNRRTEIILTPKLDELFQIMETNQND